MSDPRTAPLSVGGVSIRLHGPARRRLLSGRLTDPVAGPAVTPAGLTDLPGRGRATMKGRLRR
ncbi:hypothetical protein P1P75_22310 [Streptomyces sp. ID05-39B]|uniref:hypothetical protein n=1 Tax=Streptomyces sp. ID05-39B TaxID=3028664 RepID=UPI0029A5F7F8|nr:hypothetical protein [Streptomyces sp. ID05-39B]MDX3529087.1 hypothetical protein [Streptomyces sp. ID05-39B]